VEPAIRDHLARTYDVSFDRAGLMALNRFVSMPAGAQFARSTLRASWAPDMTIGILRGLPGIVKKAKTISERVKLETAHLPVPKKKADESKDDDFSDVENIDMSSCAIDEVCDENQPWTNPDSWSASDRRKFVALKKKYDAAAAAYDQSYIAAAEAATTASQNAQARQDGLQ
jgi:hypothetical protein